MYRVDHRYFRERNVYALSNSGPYSERKFWDRIQGVYSFRSGPAGRNDVSHVTIPDFSGMKPAERMRSLSNFYRDFSESASASSAEAASEGQTRYSRTDRGHAFMSFDIDTTPHTFLATRGAYQADQYVYAAPPPLMPTSEVGSPWRMYQDQLRQQSPNMNTLVGSYYSSDRRYDPQSQLNYLFSKVRSSKPSMDIAETLGELLIGGPFALLDGALKAFTGLMRTANKTKISSKELQYLAFSSSLRKKKGKAIAKETREKLHDLGSNSLYLQFGVAPFVSDVIKVIENLTRIHSMVYGESSRFVRGTLPITDRFTFQAKPISYGPASIGRASGAYAPPYDVSDVNVIRTWDTRLTARVGGLARPSGTQDDFLSKANTLMYNLGFQEPDLLWDLTSFSWLLDWWIHLGSSIANASRLSGGGVNVDYAYATTVVKTFYTQQLRPAPYTSSGDIISGTGGLVKGLSVVKFRRKATPFGFGGDLSSLTSGQMNILVSLGLAKTR